MRWYEGLFLCDSGLAAREPEETVAGLKGLLTKHGGAIHSFEKFDDRRLAYEVNKIRRGAYYVSVFQMGPENVSAFKRDCNYSEQVLRHLLIQDDKMFERLTEREGLKKLREEEAAKAAAEGMPTRRRRY
jgi:small subunit ribosomal protein S6